MNTVERQMLDATENATKLALESDRLYRLAYAAAYAATGDGTAAEAAGKAASDKAAKDADEFYGAALDALLKLKGKK